jgi:hypothetical protein
VITSSSVRYDAVIAAGTSLFHPNASTLVEATTGTLDGTAGAGNFRHVSVTPSINNLDDKTVVYNNRPAPMPLSR